VNKIDFNKNNVYLTDHHHYHFDKVLIATGGNPVRPNIEGVNLDNVLTLRYHNDMKQIQRQAQVHPNICVIGSSFIGMEIAATLKKEFKDKVNITVIDSNISPFERVLGEKVGKSL